jgi:XTP/dITP diphosphohydrolase
MELLFVTGNQHKVDEGNGKLRELGGEAPTLVKCPIPYPETQAEALEDVASFGLDWLADRPELFREAGFDPGSPFILEDSGLFVDGLGGFPGVYSAYVFRTLGYECVLTLLEGNEDRNATFRSIIGYCDGKGGKTLLTGECEGTIAPAAGGGGGFGYDPIFIPKGRERTFGDMSREEKGRHSHRGRSFAALHELICGR